MRCPGSLRGAKSGSKMGSESHLRRGSPQKASWKPLGALLDALGAEKKRLGKALGRFGPQKGAKMRTKMGAKIGATG